MTETSPGHNALRALHHPPLHCPRHQLPAGKPPDVPLRRASHKRFLATFLCTCAFCLTLLLNGCAVPTLSSASPPTATPQPASPITIEVPVTVEVTREVLTRQLVASTPTPPAPCARGNPGAADEIIIAAIIPLSHAHALSNALAAQTALVLAADELNGAGGISGVPVRIWWGDSANDLDRTRTLAESAILEQCAVAIIGVNDNAAAAVLDEVARRHGVPHLIISAPDDALTASQSPVAFRLTPSNSMLSTAYADWVAAVGDYNGDATRSVMLIVENSHAGLMRADLLRLAMEQRDLNVSIYPVDLPASDFSSLIARIVVKESLPDVIFIRFNGDFAQLLHKQLLSNGIGPDNGSLIVTMRRSAESAEFWQQMGDVGAFTIVDRVGPWRTNVDEPAIAFVNAYQALFDRWPEVTAFAAYDALFLINDAIHRAKTLDPAALVRALEATDINLAAGHYAFAGAPAAQANNTDQSNWHQRQGEPLVFLQFTAPNQPLANAQVIWPVPAGEQVYVRRTQ